MTRLKHRWSLGHNYLAGITAGDWWKLLRENRFGIDPVYWHRGVFVTLLSLVNSLYWCPAFPWSPGQESPCGRGTGC